MAKFETTTVKMAVEMGGAVTEAELTGHYDRRTFHWGEDRVEVDLFFSRTGPLGYGWYLSPEDRARFEVDMDVEDIVSVMLLNDWEVSVFTSRGALVLG